MSIYSQLPIACCSCRFASFLLFTGNANVCVAVLSLTDCLPLVVVMARGKLLLCLVALAFLVSHTYTCVHIHIHSYMYTNSNYNSAQFLLASKSPSPSTLNRRQFAVNKQLQILQQRTYLGCCGRRRVAASVAFAQTKNFTASGTEALLLLCICNTLRLNFQ